MSRTVVVKGFSGLRQTVTIGPYQLVADEAKDVGSNDEGADPYEYLLAASRAVRGGHRTGAARGGTTLRSFTPTLPWIAGIYHIRVGSILEDVCGNSIAGAFDRPLRKDPIW
jgi:hypothetical protein